MKKWHQFVFYDKLSKCLLSLFDVSAVCMLTIKVSQWARENFCRFRKQYIDRGCRLPQVLIAVRTGEIYCVIVWYVWKRGNYFQEIWVPGLGHLLFFAWRNRTKSHHSMCSSVASTCFYTYTKTLLLTTSYLFSILIDETPYFVGIVDDMDSIFVRESSIGSVLNIFYPLTIEVVDQIWPNFGAPQWGVWPKILLKSQMPHICPGFSPQA